MTCQPSSKLNYFYIQLCLEVYHLREDAVYPQLYPQKRQKIVLFIVRLLVKRLQSHPL